VPEIIDGAAEAMRPYVFSDTLTTPVRRAAHGDSSGVRGAAWLRPLEG
jgi:fructokinase